uniref:uncharacterized protein LOC122783990 isoform X2 n=1 Tax=Solea senegalensis TaxID=28829 RepID=UPI001CD850B0|nr:uncharacterized protein LOC122783990 isoform X2 [Solea senegalensis]
MAETSLGVYSVATTLLKSAVAGFAFGEAALITLKPALMEDVVLLNAAAQAAGRASSTGVGVVTSCLMFTSVLISLGSGFLFAAVVMKLSAKVGGRLLWWAEATAGASVVVGAVTTGVLVGILPPWIYFAGQAILVLAVYSCSNINDMTTALLIIFTTLYLSVTYGRMGVLVGLFFMGLTISALCALRCQLLERIVFYCVFVGILGFSVGLVAGEAKDGSEAEVVLMLQSVLWVVFLSAGLLGGGLGTVAMVGVGTEVAGKVAMGAAIISSVSLRIILQSSSTLEARGNIGGTLGAAAAAGVSLGAASVAAKQSFGSRRSVLAVLGAVVVGVILAVQGVALKATPLTTCELLTVTFVAVGTFVLGAPKSPFHTHVNLQRGLLTGPDLIKAIGMETVTAAAAPIGAGALGAAVLGTAALGRLGSVGVLVAILLACGSTLSGRIGKSPPTASAHRD